MSKSHFSLKDVAKEAEVSSTTVSRYLNGTLRLPDSTSDRINKAVKKLRYHPNPHARRLSLGKSEQIALILPDLANPFFAKLAASIERAAAEYGSMVSLHATSNKDLRELAALRCAADDRVESLIFMTNRLPSKEVAKELSNFKRVVPLLDRNSETVWEAFRLLYPGSRHEPEPRFPAEVYCDKDGSFAARFEEECRSRGASFDHSIPHRPDSNAMAEGWHCPLRAPRGR